MALEGRNGHMWLFLPSPFLSLGYICSEDAHTLIFSYSYPIKCLGIQHGLSNSGVENQLLFWSPSALSQLFLNQDGRNRWMKKLDFLNIQDSVWACCSHTLTSKYLFFIKIIIFMAWPFMHPVTYSGEMKYRMEDKEGLINAELASTCRISNPRGVNYFMNATCQSYAKDEYIQSQRGSLSKNTRSPL